MRDLENHPPGPQPRKRAALEGIRDAASFEPMQRATRSGE
jgi:hypothetical protein